LRVLVTGSSGFIGSAIADKLEASGCNVVRTTRKKSKANNINLIYLDLSKLETISKLANHQRFDVIIHFGAKIGWSNESIEELFVTNVLATGLLANLSTTTDTLLVFSSAAIVCGAKKEMITTESSINPDTDYGKSKQLAEELIRMSGVRSCIFRIGGVFGLNGPNHLGINISITEALNQISPKLYGSGKAHRNYIYLWDVVACVEHAINYNIQGTHLLAGVEKISIQSMIEKICQTLGSDIKLNKQAGIESKGMLIAHSENFPNSRSFQASLNDIKFRAGVN
jgi:nucleoside-diphosphate-sugar epimerase